MEKLWWSRCSLVPPRWPFKVMLPLFLQLKLIIITSRWRCIVLLCLGVAENIYAPSLGNGNRSCLLLAGWTPCI